jgi:hypothetical protein
MDLKSLALAQLLVKHQTTKGRDVVEFINVVDSGSISALQQCVLSDLVETTRFLISSRASVQTIDDKLHTLMSDAISRGKSAMCQLLLESKACLHPSITSWCAEGTAFAYTPLSKIAAHSGYGPLAKWLRKIEDKVDTDKPFKCVKCGSSNNPDQIGAACRAFLAVHEKAANQICGNPQCPGVNVKRVPIIYSDDRPSPVPPRVLPKDAKLVDEASFKMYAKEVVQLKKCTGCLQMGYCCRDCQKAHWPVHKLSCKTLMEAM